MIPNQKNIDHWLRALDLDLSGASSLFASWSLAILSLQSSISAFQIYLYSSIAWILELMSLSAY